MEFDFGPAVLTSISSYTDRDILVVRDASQLTGSVTFDILGERGRACDCDSPLRDEHDGRGVHPGIAARVGH